MSVPTADSPQQPDPPDIWTGNPRRREDDSHLPLCLRMPGPQPHNIGLSPYRGLLKRAEPVNLGQLRAKLSGLHQEMAAAVRQLAGRDAANEALIAAVQEKLEALMAGFAERVDEVEALIVRANHLNDRLAHLEAVVAKLAARVDGLDPAPAPLTRRAGEKGARR